MKGDRGGRASGTLYNEKAVFPSVSVLYVALLLRTCGMQLRSGASDGQNGWQLTERSSTLVFLMT